MKLQHSVLSSRKHDREPLNRDRLLRHRSNRRGGTVPAQTSYDRCLTTGDPAFCNNIQRDTAGTLHLLNEAPVVAAGISTRTSTLLQTRQKVSMLHHILVRHERYGIANFDYAATFLDTNYTIAIPGDDKVECADAYAGPVAART